MYWHRHLHYHNTEEVAFHLSLEVAQYNGVRLELVSATKKGETAAVNPSYGVPKCSTFV